jgi:hypothetical protein
LAAQDFWVRETPRAGPGYRGAFRALRASRSTIGFYRDVVGFGTLASETIESFLSDEFLWPDLLADIGVRSEMMSRNKIVLMIILSIVSAFAIAASLLYSYASNTVWYLGPRTAITPSVVLIPVICAIDVIGYICLMRKKTS